MFVTFRPMPPFFISLMLVMIMPLVAVVVVVPDELLPRRGATEMIVIPPMFVEMQVRLRFIHHYFATMKKIKIVIARR
jgi:hypothetical protein